MRALQLRETKHWCHQWGGVLFLLCLLPEPVFSQWTCLPHHSWGALGLTSGGINCPLLHTLSHSHIQSHYTHTHTHAHAHTHTGPLWNLRAQRTSRSLRPEFSLRGGALRSYCKTSCSNQTISLFFKNFFPLNILCIKGLSSCFLLCCCAFP